MRPTFPGLEVAHATHVDLNDSAQGCHFDHVRADPIAQIPPFGAGPLVFDTATQHELRAVVVAKGLSHPWSMAFLPDGGIVVAERSGNLRVVRDGASAR